MAILFRPVGLNELSLIWDLEFHGFPPRLASQPFFYPVANAEYAHEIATKWNVKDEASGFAGFVTRFDMADDYLATLEPHVVGTRSHVEYWVPAKQVEEFNHAITSRISVYDAFFGPEFVGYIPQEHGLRGKSAVEQFVILAKAWEYNPRDFLREVSANCKAVYLNSWFWTQHDFSAEGIDPQQKVRCLDRLRKAWEGNVVKIPLPPSLGEAAGGSGTWTDIKSNQGK